MAFEIENNNDEFTSADDFAMSTRIMVFGVGGAGGNAVAHMVESGVSDVDYVIANTDVAALRNKDGSKMKRIQIGRKTSMGRGAGSDPTKGKAAAEETRDELAAQLDGVAMLFVTAGMGGGTGTGAAPVVASLAKEKGILTVGVVTKPFGFEGEAKMTMAIAGISEMRKYVDALIIIPNERLKQLNGTKITLRNAFREVDNILCKAVSGIIHLLQGDGYVNADFSDLITALKDSGIAHIAIGKGKGDNKLEDALDEVVNSPLLETSITGARRGLINVSVPDSFNLDDYESLMEDVMKRFDSNVRYKPGIFFDDNLADDELEIIVVATDFVEDAGNSEPVSKQEAEPVPSVTVTSAPEGDSGNVGFSENTDKSGNSGFPESSDIDTLLKKLNHLNGYNNMN